MPKLWNHTIEAHRAAVKHAVLDAAGALIHAHGLAGLSMSELAERSGIGRATLYKYYAGIEAVLEAWHAAQIRAHLDAIAEQVARPGPASARLAGALAAYAAGIGGHHAQMMRALHPSGPVAAGEVELAGLLAPVIGEAVEEGAVRGDVPAKELAAFAVHALGAARQVEVAAARERLVLMVLRSMAGGPFR